MHTDISRAHCHHFFLFHKQLIPILDNLTLCNPVFSQGIPGMVGLRGAQGAPGSLVSEFLYSFVRGPEATGQMMLLDDHTEVRIVYDEFNKFLIHITQSNVISLK